MSRGSNPSIQRPQELVEFNEIVIRGIEYWDKHPAVQYGTYGIAFLGSLKFIAYLRTLGRFRHSRNIPKKYIKENVKLQGIVRRVDPETKALMVEHIPVIQIRQSKPDDLLPVALSGVRVNALGYQWLDIASRNQPIEFTLLAINDKSEVECIVMQNEGWLKKRCLNTQIVQLGLGQIAPLDKSIRNNKFYKDLYLSLQKLEKNAVQKRNGVWSTLPPNNSWWNFLMVFGIDAFGRIRNSMRRSPVSLPA